ncbi:MAG TPA: class I SAM-dependent methyltransferase [Devosia sp.]|nr:class I SAM-dependent methyltransferase [Devosia sp.]
MRTQAQPAYSAAGHCPICEAPATFSAKYDWYRDHLLCSGCGSIPRERALALILERQFPNWRDLSIHESSPGTRGISPKLRSECSGYMATQYFPRQPLAKMIDGFRNENLEVQTFAAGSFDLVVTLDVLEHLNEPSDALAEIARTLKPGGAFVFTVPTYKDRITSERRSRYLGDGTVEHLAEPEYHGNPISDAGSLVTFHYGYDLAELITVWSDMDVEVTRFHDRQHGIIGELTEVYVARKRPAAATGGSRPAPAADGV